MIAAGQLFLVIGGACLLIAFALYLFRDTPISDSVRSGAIASSRKPMRSPAPRGIQGKFRQAQIGQSVTLSHPAQGRISARIHGTIKYTELWQRVKSPNEPWVPTGNEFTAHGCGTFLLYEWKDKLFVLDEFDALSDQDIATHFLPYAKRFGESNETAEVTFTYPPAVWRVIDIGKFNVRSAEGSDLRLSTGAVGRFIHASGPDNRILVVEDYQSGSGGSDTAWNGYSISWDDLKQIA
jgi:hypothetical protein